MNKLMIDLETLSTRPDAFVTAAGLVVFNDNFIVHSEGAYVDLAKGYGHIDASTVRWWNEQDPQVRAQVYNGTWTPEMVAQLIDELVKEYKPDEVWANSPSFDLIIIREWYKNMKAHRGFDPGPFPMHFRTERDVRTLARVAEQKNINAGSWGNKNPHNPVADAEAQACGVIEILQRLRA